MLLGLADCRGDLVLLQRHGLPQHHLNGRTYVEEEVVRAREYYQRRDQSDGAADRRANHGAFPLLAERLSWTKDIPVEVRCNRAEANW